MAPGIHYFMGGIKVDVCHRTAIKSLYAAGECCAQYHGANRLGGNSLLGAIYGGRVAGKYACIDETAADGASGGKTVAGANEGKNVFGRNKDRIAESSKTSNTADIISSREADEKLGEILAEALGVIRNEETMEKGLHELEGRKDSFSLLG